MESSRRATAADLSAIVALAREGRVELAAIRGGPVWSVRESRSEPVEPDLAGAVEGENSRVAVVGLIDDAIVGFATMGYETLHDATTLAVVADIYVTPSARGVGVGEAMMDLLIVEATAAGAFGIDAIALPGDRATKNFFERFGLTARAIVVHRSLLPPSEPGP